jgi:uncharacterized protein (DUF362 family)
MKKFAASYYFKLCLAITRNGIIIYARKRAFKIYAILIGIAALAWFLIRVIPKPQRASYPCQRAAFPIASSFIIWITGSWLSQQMMKKAFNSFKGRQFIQLFTLGILSILIFLASVFFIQIQHSTAEALDLRQIKTNARIMHQNSLSNSDTSYVLPSAIVSIVKSSKDNASEINQSDIDSIVNAAVTLAGGFDSLVHEGDTVVLKPNLISSRVQNDAVTSTFPKEANGIATDYRIIQAVVNLVRLHNVTGKLFLIEGSGYGVTRTNATAMGYDEITGLDSIIYLDEFSGSWYDKNAPDIVTVSLPVNKKRYTGNNEYYLHKIYYNAKVLISLPCLKTHFLTGVTGAVKNVGIGATPVRMYGNGAAAGNIDDMDGRWNHIDHGNFSSYPTALHNWIHDFYLCRKIDYVIMDGLQGAQYGPFPGSSGDSYKLNNVQMNMRVILAGKDALSVDAIESYIMGMDPYLVGHLQLLANDSAGCINPALIKVKGTQVHEIKKRFNEHSPGSGAEYSDFTAPEVGVPSPCTIVDSTLHITLAIGSDVVKVEVVYDDTILPGMFINNLTDINVALKPYQNNISKVKVMVYDQYLNCTTLNPDHVITEVSRNDAKEVILFPNPVGNSLNIELPSSYNSKFDIKIYSNDGKLVYEEKSYLTVAEPHKMDVSNLSAGNYILLVTSPDYVTLNKFIKEIK